VAIRLLVVDDNEQFARSACELLALRGFAVLGAVSGGDAALASIEDGCPDGLLLDINMPGRDGFSIARSLSSACPKMKIVLTSSDVQEVSQSRLEGCGALAFLPKTSLVTSDLTEFFGSPVTA
jgi:two-component system response regulator DesR